MPDLLPHRHTVSSVISTVHVREPQLVSSLLHSIFFAAYAVCIVFCHYSWVRILAQLWSAYNIQLVAFYVRIKSKWDPLRIMSPELHQVHISPTLHIPLDSELGHGQSDALLLVKQANM